ncbi:unnamed protein product [Ixodes persulcatus]
MLFIATGGTHQLICKHGQKKRKGFLVVLGSVKELPSKRESPKYCRPNVCTHVCRSTNAMCRHHR